eukprot:4582397-Prymnesium_polylepis.2
MDDDMAADLRVEPVGLAHARRSPSSRSRGHTRCTASRNLHRRISRPRGSCTSRCTAWPAVHVRSSRPTIECGSRLLQNGNHHRLEEGTGSAGGGPALHVAHSETRGVPDSPRDSTALSDRAPLVERARRPDAKSAFVSAD